MLVIMTTEDVPWWDENKEDVILIDKISSLDTWEDVTCLVYHSSEDDSIELSMFISELSARLDKVIYIYGEMDTLFYFLFAGMHADIYDSETYLYDEETFKFIVENYRTSQMTVRSPDEDVATVVKGISSLMTCSPEEVQKMATNKTWLRSIGAAAASVEKSVTEMNGYSSSVVTLLREAKKLISRMEQNNIELNNEIHGIRRELELERVEAETQYAVNTPYIFPSYTAPETADCVLYVKGVCPTVLLTTFLRLYTEYVNNERQIEAKLLLMHPNLQSLSEKYSDFKRLDKDTIRVVDISNSTEYVTFEPKKSVLDKFFRQDRVGLFIVYDMLMGKDMIIGSNVTKMYGASSIGVADKFNLPTEKTFLPIFGKEGHYTLTFDKNYYLKNTVTARKSALNQIYKELYSRLDVLLGLGHL